MTDGARDRLALQHVRGEGVVPHDRVIAWVPDERARRSALVGVERVLSKPQIECRRSAAEPVDRVARGQALGDEEHRLPTYHVASGLTSARKRGTGVGLCVKRGEELIEVVGRHDREHIVLEEDLVGTLLGSSTDEIAGGLVHQTSCLLDPTLGLGTHTKLKSTRGGSSHVRMIVRTHGVIYEARPPSPSPSSSSAMTSAINSGDTT